MFVHIGHEFASLKRTDGASGRTYSTPSGKSYPSVTAVTGLLGQEAIIAWRKRVGEEVANRISSKASKTGTRFHTLCETYLKNETPSPDMFEVTRFNTFKPFLNRIQNIHCLETPLYSDYLQVAGTVDCIAEFDGRLSVIDFKTSSKVKSRDDIHNYFMQCSAYAVAFEELTGIPVPRLVILMSVEDSEPLVFVEKRNDWIEKFKELRLEYKRLKGI